MFLFSRNISMLEKQSRGSKDTFVARFCTQTNVVKISFPLSKCKNQKRYFSTAHLCPGGFWTYVDFHDVAKGCCFSSHPAPCQLTRVSSALLKYHRNLFIYIIDQGAAISPHCRCQFAQDWSALKNRDRNVPTTYKFRCLECLFYS